LGRCHNRKKQEVIDDFSNISKSSGKNEKIVGKIVQAAKLHQYKAGNSLAALIDFDITVSHTIEQFFKDRIGALLSGISSIGGEVMESCIASIHGSS